MPSYHEAIGICFLREHIHVSVRFVHSIYRWC